MASTIPTPVTPVSPVTPLTPLTPLIARRAENPASFVTTADPGAELGLQPIAQYDMVIDARSPREFAEDHMPRAINLPVVDSDQYAVVGTLYKDDRHRAYLRGVADSLRNMADALDQVVARLPADARILVYCFRGGKRSRLWFDTLRTIGFRTDVLPGGWKRYRAWVRERLATLPSTLHYRVLCGATGTGKTRLLHALRAAGAQVLDLEGLANHRGSLIGAVPGSPQPSQKFFDSMLLETLAGFDPGQPVWVEAESKKIGAVQLPDGLFDAMHRSQDCWQITAPMAERVRLWHEDFGHFADDPGSLLDRLRHLLPLIGGEEFGRWQAMADAGQISELFERLMVAHYDPTYRRSSARHYPGVRMQPLDLPSLSESSLASVAQALVVGTRPAPPAEPTPINPAE